MRNLLLAIALIVTSEAFSQELPKLPPNNDLHLVNRMHEWERYSKKVLQILFPTRTNLVSKMKINVINSPSTNFAVAGTSDIHISTGFLERIRSEHEFASLISHEFGHRLLLHNQPILPPRSFFELLVSFGSGIHGTAEWTTRRANEVEADTISMMVSRKTSDVISLFLNSSSDDSSQANEEYNKVKILRERELYALRLQTMKNLSSNTFLKPVVKAGKIPSDMPSWRDGTETWNTYGKRVLLAMFPNYTDDSFSVDLDISESSQPARSFVLFGYLGVIQINTKLIRDVIKTPEEFAVLIGHEFGHIVMNRVYDLDYLDTGVSHTFDEIELRKQFEADVFATLPLQNGDCIFASLLEKLLTHPLIVGDDPKNIITFDKPRLSRLRAMCSMNR